MTKKFKKNSAVRASDPKQFITALSNAAEGLIYISETDAEIKPFREEMTGTVSAAGLLKLAGATPDAHIEESDADLFFKKLTTIKDWFGPREIERANRFAELHDVLRSGLSGIKVYRIGDVRLKIYIAGQDKQGCIAGVSTEAVET